MSERRRVQAEVEMQCLTEVVAVEREEQDAGTSLETRVVESGSSCSWPEKGVASNREMRLPMEFHFSVSNHGDNWMAYDLRIKQSGGNINPSSSCFQVSA